MQNMDKNMRVSGALCAAEGTAEAAHSAPAEVKKRYVPPTMQVIPLGPQRMLATSGLTCDGSCKITTTSDYWNGDMYRIYTVYSFRTLSYRAPSGLNPLYPTPTGYLSDPELFMADLRYLRDATCDYVNYDITCNAWNAMIDDFEAAFPASATKTISYVNEGWNVDETVLTVRLTICDNGCEYPFTFIIRSS